MSLFCIFSLRSCFLFNYYFKLYLIPNIRTIPRVMTECTSKIYSSICANSLANIDKNIDTTAKLIIVYWTRTIFLSMNIVRMES